MRTQDGLEIHSHTPEGVVQELHKMSLAPSHNDREFMRSVSDRVMFQTGKRIRTDTASHFVEDLLGIGLLLPDYPKDPI